MQFCGYEAGQILGGEFLKSDLSPRSPWSLDEPREKTRYAPKEQHVPLISSLPRFHVLVGVLRLHFDLRTIKK